MVLRTNGVDKYTLNGVQSAATDTYRCCNDLILPQLDANTQVSQSALVLARLSAY